MMVIISGTLLILLLPLEGIIIIMCELLISNKLLCDLMSAIQASNGICLQSNSQDIVALEGRSVRLECLYCSGSLHTLLWVINNVNYPILNTLPERHRFNEGQYHILIVDDIGSAMNDSTYQCASGGMISGTIHLYVIPGIITLITCYELVYVK